MKYMRCVFLLTLSTHFLIAEQGNNLLSPVHQRVTGISKKQQVVATLIISFAKGFIPGLLCSFTGCATGLIPSPSDPETKNPEFAAKIVCSCLGSYYIGDCYKYHNDQPIIAKASQIIGIYLGTVCGIGIATTINSRRA
jgi:hypothetical protein